MNDNSSNTPNGIEILLKYFRNSVGNNYSGYESYVRKIDEINGRMTITWFRDALKDVDPIKSIMDNVNSLELGVDESCVPSYKTGFKKFAQSVIGIFRANTWLSMDDYDELYCELIEKNTLFPSREVVDKVRDGDLGTTLNKNKKGNTYASWDYFEHARNNDLDRGDEYTDITDYKQSKFATEYRENASDMIVADDNTYANLYIKKAIIESFRLKYGVGIFLSSATKLFKDYEACHVWDKPTDRRYYASIANLVLVPRALAQLTDHNDAVKKLLRYEVYQRFKFCPDEENKPNVRPPKYYKEDLWRCKW